MHNKVLVLVDVQNVYYGALNFLEDGRKIDYARLKYFIEHEVTVDLENALHARYSWPHDLSNVVNTSFDVYGYVVNTPKYNGLRLFSLLRKLGYKLRVKEYPDGLSPDAEWKGSVGSMMQMDYVMWCPDYEATVFVGGSGIFEPVLQASKENWPEVRTYVAAWKNTLHSTYEHTDNVDRIIVLDDQVLR